jgi:hypothetical protein
VKRRCQGRTPEGWVGGGILDLGEAAASVTIPSKIRRDTFLARVDAATMGRDTFPREPPRIRRAMSRVPIPTRAAPAAGGTAASRWPGEGEQSFAQNELITYEALGLCPEGGAEKFVVDGDNTYGGAIVTNPSGGLLSKGHPLGATGLAQCTELVQQLRGTAGKRQTEGARLALQHNLGLGGACVVTLYERA